MKFKLINPFGYHIANRFMSIPCMNGLRSLSLIDCAITDGALTELEPGLLKLTGLAELVLCSNRLSDKAFVVVSKMCVQCVDLCMIKASHNMVELGQVQGQQLFVDLLRSISQLVYLDFANNKIGDAAIEIIERAVIFAQNPPIKEIDLSNNAFSKYGSWRLFKGNLVTIKNHNYMAFVLYPVPFNM